MDYIVPASCTDAEFRQMWAEFEWENKVAVNTNISDLQAFLQHVIKCTNMKCLTPEKVIFNQTVYMYSCFKFRKYCMNFFPPFDSFTFVLRAKAFQYLPFSSEQTKKQ